MHPNVNLIVEPDYASMSKRAAEIFAQVLRENPNGAFGFATGGTPEGMYKELISMHNNDDLDFSEITTFNLDEYHPIARDISQSYYYVMQENLFRHVGISEEQINIPDGTAPDPLEECHAYEQKLWDSGGIDMQILGIGHNGHIGFNEPSDSFAANTNYTILKESTIENNARFFSKAEEVPRHAITMGIRSIIMARSILLLCSGAAKAEILRDALQGPITPLVPASALQLHPNVIVVADKEAASLLNQDTSYKESQKNQS